MIIQQRGKLQSPGNKWETADRRRLRRSSANETTCDGKNKSPPNVNSINDLTCVIFGINVNEDAFHLRTASLQTLANGHVQIFRGLTSSSNKPIGCYLFTFTRFLGACFPNIESKEQSVESVCDAPVTLGLNTSVKGCFSEHQD